LLGTVAAPGVPKNRPAGRAVPPPGRHWNCIIFPGWSLQFFDLREVTMANEGDRSSTNPTHPRMSAGLPPGGTSTRTEEGVMGKVSEAAGQVRDTLREAASGVAERAGDAWDSTRRGFEQAAHRAQDFWTDAGNL